MSAEGIEEVQRKADRLNVVNLADRRGDWRDNLARRGQHFAGDERNVLLALRIAPELEKLVRFNEFQHVVEFARKPPWRNVQLGDHWTDDDDLHLQAWFQRHDIDVRQRNICGDCIVTIAKDWIIHPVRDYLRLLAWDGESRLQIWLADYLNAEGPPDYQAAVGVKFLTSAVARVIQPGCQVDHVLALEGPQGIGKSRTVQILGEPWTTDGLPDLHSKDAAIHLGGVWLVELAELAAMRRSETEATKAFLSRRDDRYRPPYARRSVDVARQCVFIATTNEASYLRDPTGNRRFWPVKCGRIDLPALERDRDQLWAEAVHLFEAGEAWHPTGNEIELTAHEQEQRVLVTELEQNVADFLHRQEQAGIDEVTTQEVFRTALNVDSTEDVERAVRLGRQLAEAMQRSGWQRVRAVGRGPNRRVLYQRSPE